MYLYCICILALYGSRHYLFHPVEKSNRIIGRKGTYRNGITRNLYTIVPVPLGIEPNQHVLESGLGEMRCEESFSRGTIIYNYNIYLILSSAYSVDSWRNGSAFDSRSKGCLFKSYVKPLAIIENPTDEESEAGFKLEESLVFLALGALSLSQLDGFGSLRCSLSILRCRFTLILSFLLITALFFDIFRTTRFGVGCPP